MLTKKYLRNADKQVITQSFRILLNNVWLNQKICVKYTGILIDSKLDWSSHVRLVRTKLSSALYLLFKFWKFVSIDILSYGIALLIFIYNTLLCDGLELTILFRNLLYVLHNNVLKIVTYSNYGRHVTPFYKIFMYWN